MKIKLTTTLLFSLLISSSSTYSQNRSLQLGVKIFNELTFSNQYSPGFGAQVVYRLYKKSCVESGLYYKIIPKLFFSYPLASTTFYGFDVSERNILLPVLYRYDSRLLNFTIGPILEYNLSWKITNSPPDIVIKDYITKRLKLLASASISKNFMLSPKWIVEPECRFSAYVPDGDGSYGINLSFRKKIY